ncbi:hypothetical protein [Xanthomonas citri]|uniref:hypothetical protein n=1 Tax=Xanthomonas citri TaxID=346 RepID=UPI0010394AA7|nr:hypothetical protein [Xanthomonas citri]
MNRIRILLWIFAVSTVVLALRYGQQIPFSRQWPLYEGLRTTAAIIFAVVGAWLAIAYPERLKFSVGKSAGDAVKESPLDVPLLTSPIAHSTGVLAAVLLIGLIAPLFAQLEVVKQHISWARGFSYGMLACLTLWQIWTVISTLKPASAVKDDANSEKARDDHVRSVLGGAKVSRRKEEP